jgi:hypothetical protein
MGRREEVSQVLKAVNFGVNILVLGPRGAGKTSFLHTCEWELEQQNRRTVWVSGAFVESAMELLDAVAFQFEVPRSVYQPGFPEVAVANLGALSGRREPVGGPAPLLTAIREFASRLEIKREGQPDPRHWVVIIDDLRPEVGHALFGQARDELWSLPLVWIAAGDKARTADYLKPPADSFFGKVIELGPLDDDAAATILRTRALGQFSDDVARRITEQAQGNPRRLITLATEAVLGGAESLRALEQDSATAARLRELGPSAQRLWEVLVPMNQAAANDVELLDRIGWSRVRASQVLNQLEAAGLVESSTEKAPHGRPRKVYRVRTALNQP